MKPSPSSPDPHLPSPPPLTPVPLAPPPSARRTTEALGAESTGIFLINVLVIDLDAATREVIGELMANRGYQVTAVDSIEEAARLLARAVFDCVVVKLRESWASPVEQLLRYVPKISEGRRRPFVLGVLLDDPPPVPLDWLKKGVDDCVMGLARGPYLDLRLAVVEKEILERRDVDRRRLQSAGQGKNFESLFRQAPAAVLIVTARDGMVLEASETAGRLLQVPLMDLRGRYLSLVLPGLLGRDEWNTTPSGDGPVRLEAVPHRMPDGTSRTLEVRLSRCLWSERPALWLRVDDVSADRLADEARMRAARQEAARAVASGAAQVLNDALTAVRGNIDLLSKQNVSRTDSRDLLESAASACQRAEETVQTLASLARGGGLGLRRRPLDLRPFLGHAVSFAALRGRVQPIFNLPTDLPAVEADDVHLKEAVLALVDNADQAMAGGGPLTISGSETMRPGSPVCWIQIEFRDAGEGILPAHLSRIFDPYFTTRQGRQGLGLARALGIVTAHGGTLEVESHPGQGTLVRMLLPALPKAPAAPATVASGHTAPLEALNLATRPVRGRVLAMDDDAGIRVIVEKMLALHDFEVYAVRDGAEAIIAYRRAQEMKNPFDVVLLDLDVRGGMGGRECIARLRGEFPGVKAILCTGYLDDSLLENHREHGFSGVLTKPFHVERLVSAVSKLAGSER